MSKYNADERFTVDGSYGLLEFLFEAMPNRSKKTVKQVLQRGQVFVNGTSTSQFNVPLKSGDIVEIRLNAPNKRVDIRGVNILHEDADIIVVEKDAGMLSISTDKEQHETVYRLLSDYVKMAHPRNKVFVVHRLDRETSGVMVYAKTKRAQQTLQNNWKEIVHKRTYIALVEGLVKENGTVKSYLTEDQTLTMRSSRNEKRGKLAVTHYKVIKSNRKQSKLEVNLDTGRKNQIRIHMKEIGHPIIGDKKYGATSNPFKRIGLHAHILAFKHPVTGELIHFESRLPKIFM